MTFFRGWREAADATTTAAETAVLPSGYPVVLAALEQAEASLERRSSSLDTKAATVLGASGIVIGLVFDAATLLSIPTLVAALFAALMAIRAFLPQVGLVLQVKPFRDRYLLRPERDAALASLDTRIVVVTESEQRIVRKVTLLKRAFWGLGVSAACASAEALWTLATADDGVAKYLS